MTLIQTSALGAIITSQEVTLRADVSVTDFLITFSDTPDFFSVDAEGRQADSFQFFINPSPTIPFQAGYDGVNTTLIRGEEIHVSGDVRVRDIRPSSGDPYSGGWGALRGSVAFLITGNLVTFSVPNDMLGVSGPFGYHLEGYRYGADYYNDFGLSAPLAPVPEPSTILAGLLALLPLGAGVLRTLRRLGARG
jgi:hypothetical protein